MIKNPNKSTFLNCYLPIVPIAVTEDDNENGKKKKKKKNDNPLLDDSEPDVINIEMHAKQNVENVDNVNNVGMGSIGNSYNGHPNTLSVVNTLNMANIDNTSDMDDRKDIYAPSSYSAVTPFGNGNGNENGTFKRVAKVTLTVHEPSEDGDDSDSDSGDSMYGAGDTNGQTPGNNNDSSDDDDNIVVNIGKVGRGNNDNYNISGIRAKTTNVRKVHSIHVTPGNFDDVVYVTPGGGYGGYGNNRYGGGGGTDDGSGVTRGGLGGFGATIGFGSNKNNNGYNNNNASGVTKGGMYGGDDKLEPLTQYSEVMSEKKSIVNKIIDVDRDKSLWFCVFYYAILLFCRCAKSRSGMYLLIYVC